MPNDNRSLIAVLKNLYSQLSQISWGMTQVRANSYKHESKAPSNITTVLNKKIEDLSSQVVSKSADKVKDINEPDEQSNSESKAEKIRDAKVVNVTGVESEFVKYLKHKKPPTITQPHMGENLKASVWEHIHAALRHAKNGDLESAKLHVTIAGTALEEAGDYMSHDDYSELVLQIEGYFSEPIK